MDAHRNSRDGAAPTPTGRFHVRRESGLLPPGVTKVLEPGAGVTRWFGVPVGKFEIRGTVFHYLRWPVEDAVALGADGLWHGEGRVFGIRFCRFRLDPIEAQKSAELTSRLSLHSAALRSGWRGQEVHP